MKTFHTFRPLVVVLTLALVFTNAQVAVLAIAREPVRAKHGMVASTNEVASRVGVDIMKRGGNAVDAAIAVGAALSTVVDYRILLALLAVVTAFAAAYLARKVEPAAVTEERPVEVVGSPSRLAARREEEGAIRNEDGTQGVDLRVPSSPRVQ